MKKLFHACLAALLVMPMLAQAHGPTRQVVKEQITINASPDQVWEVIKDFGGIAGWSSWVTDVAMQGDNIRVLTVDQPGNPTITQEIVTLDDEKRQLIYKNNEMSVTHTITFNSKDTPYYALPVSTYRSWFSVKADGAVSQVTWEAKFYRSFMDNPPVPEGQADQDAVDAVRAVYQQGLKDLKAALEK